MASESPDHSKSEALFKGEDPRIVVSSEEVRDDVGGLTFEQYAAGGLGRHLGVFSTTSLIIGRIIGAGVFSSPSSIVSSVGSVSVSGLCVWLEFACMMPRSGGEMVHLEAVYRRPKMLIAVVFAIQAIALEFTANGCIILSSNIIIASGHVATEWQLRGIALGVITVVTLVHTFFPSLGVHGMNFFTILKMVLLLFVVVTGWVVLAGGVSSVKDSRASFYAIFVHFLRLCC
ncbi:High-affinity methionine permease [Tolypocladium paradoxum]|uniref:High-affinity methionine permease n=1 Tax=Tolypocladium paradoxum TaxID=94208 RepID=A0A2S4KZ60_9HYPO|nr:High-affinity methionine permease [Tolypocladium paradoxum]